MRNSLTRKFAAQHLRSHVPEIYDLAPRDPNLRDVPNPHGELKREEDRTVKRGPLGRDRALTVTPGGQSPGWLKPLRIQRSTNRAREKTGAILLTTDRVGKLGVRIR